MKGKDSLFCTTAIHLPNSFTHMISEVEIYLQKRDTDYGRVERSYLWFFIIFRGDLVLHGGLCCTSIFTTTHLTSHYTIHQYALHYTPLCTTLYTNIHYTIRHHALHCTPPWFICSGSSPPDIRIWLYRVFYNQYVFFLLLYIILYCTSHFPKFPTVLNSCPQIFI